MSIPGVSFRQLRTPEPGRDIATMLAYIAAFFASVLLSSLLTWGVRNFSQRYGLATPPRSNRHIHKAPVPRLGGLAIFATFLITFLLYSIMAGYGWMAAPPSHHVGRILELATAVFVVGLIDDLIRVGPWVKLLVEIIGGLGLYFSGIRFDFFAAHSANSLTAGFCLLATVFWVVLICNAINLIDGIDGLAAGAALFSMITVFTVAMAGRPGIATSTVILAGSIFGFLIFNFNPASIFMGDSGSLFVGFLLSALVLAEQPQHTANSLRGILVALVCFALPLTDVVLTLLRRFLNGHSLFGADREHIHHKLMEMGLSQRQVVAILYAVCALFSILSLFLLNPSPAALIPVAGVVLLTVFFGVRRLRYHELTEILRSGEPVLLKKRRVANNIAIRKTAAGLQLTRDPNTIATLLEASLHPEFAGFAILLSENLKAQRFPRPWTPYSLEMYWRKISEKLTLTIDLTADDGSPLGQLLLYHDACTPLLVRAELIRGVLRKSLARALQNTLSPSPRFTPPAVTQRGAREGRESHAAVDVLEDARSQ